jgi:hypothetical protein
LAFADSGQRLGDLRSWDVELGDLDDDGDLDAIVANSVWSLVWLNDGGRQGGRPGTFADSAQRLGTISGLALGDLDGDGDLDNLAVDPERGTVIWLNDGTGTFSDQQRLASEVGYDVALGDTDGDGDLDAYIASDGPNTLWLNEGGEFSRAKQRFASHPDRTITALLADLDGDGDLDVFDVNYGGRHRVWLNAGGAQGGASGIYVDSGQVLEVGTGNSHGAALGDLDGDGDLDAFVTVTHQMAFQVWINDGAGTFANSGQSLPSSSAQKVALGDLDGDGDLDAFVTNTGHSDAGAGDTVWLNEGGAQGGRPGQFRDSGLRLGHEYSLGLALGDLDGDGDLDAFVANSYFSDSSADRANRIWLNVSVPSTCTPVP